MYWKPSHSSNDIIINDTWESVALASENEACDETTFEDDNQINEGSAVTNPQTNTQYCFRVADEESDTHYINAYVTADSFEGLDLADAASGGLESTLGDSDSKAMLNCRRGQRGRPSGGWHHRLCHH